MNYFSLIASIFLIAFGGISLLDEFSILGIASLLGGTLFASKEIFNRMNPGRPTISLKDFDAEQAAMLKESFDKAVKDYYAIEDMQKKIRDQEVVEQLKQMQKVAHSMLMYLEKYPDKIPTANKFIDYYQDRALSLVNSFHDLESTGLTTAGVEEQKSRMKETLFGIDAAYADQFERLLREKMLSTDAELEVMNQQMDAEGIKREKVIRDVPKFGDPEHEFEREDQKPIEPEVIEEREWANVSQGRITNYNMDHIERDNRRIQSIPLREDRRLIRRRQGTFLTEHERMKAIKEKSIMSILAIFFGSFGAHKFYQRKNLQGVMYLFFCWTSIPTWISIAEGIRYIFMPLEDFYIQYVDED